VAPVGQVHLGTLTLARQAVVEWGGALPMACVLRPMRKRLRGAAARCGGHAALFRGGDKTQACSTRYRRR